MFEDIPPDDEHDTCRYHIVQLVTLARDAGELLTRCLETDLLHAADDALIDDIRAWFVNLSNDVLGEEATEH